MEKGYQGNQNARKYDSGTVRKNVSLEVDVVEKVKDSGEKLSPLINRLLKDWLKHRDNQNG
ncbi:MAG: hypothetical protein P1U89_18860 [Verrucomicrobiales bacterium]|nr:hypothetical protein [Verrucomicrobiales bacterium]